MCGFVALVCPDRSSGIAAVERMRERIAHRGPDDRGAVVIDDPAGAVGLGHRRLSIIDLSAAAAQPMASACGRATVVYNGEIYNYVELREELKRAGRRFRTSSDTEVLLEAYLHWGAECLPRLNGQFGFALWDAQRRELLVARDRFGEKPLYYAELPGGGLAFGSEIKALLACPGVRTAPDEGMLSLAAAGGHDFLTDRTYFAGIRKLMPAHAMVVAPGGRVLRRWRYWTPDFEAPRLSWKPAALVEEFGERFLASVRMRLRSDVRVGACLSGGLDSSSIVSALAAIWSERGVLQENFTISARFDDDPTVSEGRYIDAVVAKTGVRSLMVTPHPGRFGEEFGALHLHHEEPGLTGSHYNEWCVMRTARENGCIVMLDGQGADELLAGYQHFFGIYQRDLARRHRWIRLLSNTLPFRQRMLDEAANYEQAERRFDYRTGFGMGALLKMALGAAPADRPQAPGLPSVQDAGPFRYEHAFGLLYAMLPRQLHSADRNAMAFGVESRFPFLDHELVDWCLKLPDQALIHGGWQKYILRKAFDGRLPAEVSWRVDKVGYAAPQDEWLRGPLRSWAEARLFSLAMQELPGFDKDVLRRAWEAHQARSANCEGLLWRWLSLDQFHRTFFGEERHALAPAEARAAVQ